MYKSNCNNPVDAHMNLLLAALPEKDFERLLPNLEPVTLPLGECISESGAQTKSVYFPTTAIVSLLYVLEDGSSGEISVVGRDGIIGITHFMGGETTPNRAVVQSGGYAFKLEGEILRSEFDSCGVLRSLLLRYTMALLSQTAQTAACNRYHSVDQQLCRWLLLSIDRLPSSKLVMTQELIANMLGVRREGVTLAAEKLQAAGLITYHRGHITVLDRFGLEERVCECYKNVKTEASRLLPEIMLN